MAENKGALKSIFGFMGRHKILTIIIAWFVVGGITTAILTISRKAHKNELASRDYSIEFDEKEYSFDCNTNDGSSCSTKIISGSYSQYTDVEVTLNDYAGYCSMSAGKFECEMRASLHDLYATNNFDNSTLPSVIEDVITIGIKEKDSSMFDSALFSKKMTVTYKLSESDKANIVKANADWVKQEKERKEKAAAEEAKKAEEEAKKTEEQKKAESNNQSNSNTSKPQPATNQNSGACGYQCIYDQYAARLRSECPSLSITECAEINNEGIEKMADYMWKASGTDGQYATYEEWSGKLFDVYLESAR